MPSMGNRLCAARPSTRLIDLFVAGMLVFMGLQAAANAAPVAKPHRLERSQLPQQDMARATEIAGCIVLAQPCLTSADHGFVHHILSVPGLSVSSLVAVERRFRIGFESPHPNIRGFPLLEAVFPRGPPKTRF